MNPSILPKKPSYFYTITGDAKLGDNKTEALFSQEGSRFPIGTKNGIMAQTSSWTGPVDSDISPLYQNAPGTVPSKLASGHSTPAASNM